MATRHQYEILINSGNDRMIVDGYKFNDLIWLHKDPADDLWVGWQSKLGKVLAAGKHGRFKKKRACLAFLEVVTSKLPLDFDTFKQYEKYQSDNEKFVVSVLSEALEVAKQND